MQTGKNQLALAIFKERQEGCVFYAVAYIIVEHGSAPPNFCIKVQVLAFSLMQSSFNGYTLES